MTIRETITIPARPAQVVAAGSQLLPVIVIDSATPTIVNIAGTMGVESSYILPAGTTNFEISTHNRAGFRLAYSTGIFVATAFKLVRNTYRKAELNPSFTYTIYFGPVAKDAVFSVESWA